MNYHQYYLNTSSIYLMLTENNMLHISKNDLPHFFVVRLTKGYINFDAISLEIGGGLDMASVYNWEGNSFSIFDYSCYGPPRMKVILK